MVKKIKQKSKKAQEEMVGFAVIIVIVSVIILVFLGFSLKQKDTKITESYELQSFLQVLLQQTIEQENGVTSIREMIKDCERYESNCENLKSILSEILEKSWNVDEESKIKGYLLKIYTEDKEVLLIKEGNETKSYIGASQDLADEVKISLVVYG